MVSNISKANQIVLDGQYHIDCEYCERQVRGNTTLLIARTSEDNYIPFCSPECMTNYFNDLKEVSVLYSKLFDIEYKYVEPKYTCIDTYTVNDIVRMRNNYHKHAAIPEVHGDGSPAERFLNITILEDIEFGRLTSTIKEIKSELEEAMEYKSKGYNIEAAPALTDIYHVKITK